MGQRHRQDEHTGAAGILRECYAENPSAAQRRSGTEVVRNYVPRVHAAITTATVVRASEIGETWNLSFWDGMIVAAAEQVSATELLTEDLHHGQIVAGVRIRNPFMAD
jgi:predicted nucleic acid-binding protein